MKSPLKLAALVALALGGIAGRSSADLIFELSCVSFDDGGTLTGTFTTDDAITSLVSADLVSSAGTSLSGSTYLVPGGAIHDIDDDLPESFEINLNDFHGILLTFDGGLKATGADLLMSGLASFEYFGDGLRFISAGSVVPLPVPEPATLGLVAAGLPAILAVARTRRSGRPARPGRSGPPRRGAG
jgi:hypothetical protein